MNGSDAFVFLAEHSETRHVHWLNGDIWEIELTPFNYTGGMEEVSAIVCDTAALFGQSLRRHRTTVTELDGKWWVLVRPPNASHCVEIDTEENRVRITLDSDEDAFDVIDDVEVIHTINRNQTRTLEWVLTCPFSDTVCDAIHSIHDQIQTESLLLLVRRVEHASAYERHLPRILGNLQNVSTALSTNLVMSEECIRNLHESSVFVLWCAVDETMCVDSKWMDALQGSTVHEVNVILGMMSHLHINLLLTSLIRLRDWQYDFLQHGGHRVLKMQRGL